MRGFSSLRVRLIGLLTAVVVTAMGVVFLYVVPTLRANLISQRLDALEAVAVTAQQSSALRHAVFNQNVGATGAAVSRIGRGANAHVVAFSTESGSLDQLSESDTEPLYTVEPVVRAAVGTSAIVRGRARNGGIVVAFGVPGGVVALSQQVSDVNATADLVERRILIATALAIAVACAVGWGAAYAASRRLRRLELAAARISVGEFDQPIGDSSLDELGALARAFDLMSLRLDRVDRARKDFIANASHELRTPLFSLGGFLELLDDPDLDQDTRDEFLREMHEQVVRLTKLATDLLDLSRLDTGAVEISHESIDLATTARGLVREFRGLAAGRGSRVVLVRPPQELPAAIADEQRVQQIGRALVDNAIRHTPGGTEVRVSVESFDGIVQLSVSDDGPGIDASARDRLFERFARGESTTAAGSGLGLAIARELAERMDGSLELQSSEGETRFALSLPAESR